MSKDPAFLMYSQDFIVGTATMSDEDTGKFATLLCFFHQKGHLSKEEITNLIGIIPESIISKLSTDRLGLLFSKKLDKVIDERGKFSKKQSKIAKLRWDKERCQDDAKPNAKVDAKSMLSSSSSSSSSSSITISEEEDTAALFFDEYVLELWNEQKRLPSNKHIDFNFELEKMKNWCEINPTAKRNKNFILNWLKKIPPPVNDEDAWNEFRNKQKEAL